MDLFKYLADNLGVLATESELNEIRMLVLGKERYISEANSADSLPISKVVFFKLKNGKYLTSNGTEITTDFILKHEHAIFNDNGYVIL